MEGFAKLVLVVFSILRISISVDTMTVNQIIRDGDTITSPGGSFELGFFSPDNSKNRYLGIWFKKVATGTVVWVANRQIPLIHSSGVLKLTDQGTLVILDANDTTIWSSNSSQSAKNPNAQLLDSGNLVVKNENDSDPEKFLWQSFDYPCDTLIPGMKFGRNRVTGLDRYLSSWKTSNDPSVGNFTYRLDPAGSPQLLVRNGSAVTFRSGPWNGLRFSGFPQLRPNSVYSYAFIFNDEEMYYTFELVNRSVITRLELSPEGFVQRFTWIDRIGNWKLYSSAQTDDCDSYALCGVYGICKINRSPKCECMKGFEPKFPGNWEMADWSDGCVRTNEMVCEKSNVFLKYSSVKLPDTRNSWVSESKNLKECASMCLRNCSCTAYANSDIRDGGSGCLLWFDDLIDIREFTENGQDFYIRMAEAELGKSFICSLQDFKKKHCCYIKYISFVSN